MSSKGPLASLDLTPKEEAVYLVMLELGEVAVPLVAKKTGIKRPTTYAVLKSLEGKGLVSHTTRGKKMLFAAQHPRKLIAEAEIRLQELRHAVPQLESMMKSERNRPRVVVYEGKDGLDRAYDDMFIATGEALYMGSIALSKEIFTRTFQKLRYAHFSPEFRARELVDESPQSREYIAESRGHYRLIRYIPENFLPFETDICTIADMIVITSVKDDYFSVKIESSEIAHAFRILFEAMWQISKEPDLD